MCNACVTFSWFWNNVEWRLLVKESVPTKILITNIKQKIYIYITIQCNKTNFLHSETLLVTTKPIQDIMKIWEKLSGRKVFSLGSSSGFPFGFYDGKSLGAPLPVLGRPCPSIFSELSPPTPWIVPVSVLSWEVKCPPSYIQWKKTLRICFFFFFSECYN